MPTFVMIGWDGADGAQHRNEHRSAHVQHVSNLNETGRIELAGPIRDDNDERSVGAVIVFDAADLTEAREIVNRDPYVLGGVFSNVEVRPFKLVLPEQP